MEKIFDTLINSFINDKIGIAEHFLNDKLALELKQNLIRLYQETQMQHAGTGNNKLVTHDKMVRSDQIYWLDKKHHNIYEDLFFELMDEFVLYLNRTCYAGIKDYEFHYALYEAGSFYKRHVDQFQNDQSRQYSMILYLNTDWQESDGGELCIHRSGSRQHISPDQGKGVFFKSDELEHEVLLAHKQRMSITGWLKK